MAGRPASDRKTLDRVLYDLLADLPDGFGPSAAEAGVRTSVAASGRWQDEQVQGNVLYADELVDFFGVDAVRYFVLHEMPFENDGVITWELMVERLNSDLANTLGQPCEPYCFHDK